MRMFALIALVIIGYIAWKIVKLARAIRSERDREPDRARGEGIEFPPDASYRNIEDADFEDLTDDDDKPA